MSTPVTAAEVASDSWVIHDEQLCHITEKHETGTGGVFLSWTEDLGGHEAYFNGTFAPDALFGELANN